MKKIVISLICACLATNTFAIDKMKKVFINQIIRHPALDITVKGIVDGMEQNGYIKGQNVEIRVELAQAKMALASQIATKFISQDPDIVVGVGTVSAQSFLKYTKNGQAKLIFSSITDPVQAGLVEDLKKPNRNISGVSNFVDLESQLRLFKRIQPQLKKLGILYNPGEANSLSTVNRLKVLCPKSGITLIPQIAVNITDVAQAMTKLSAEVDAVFISNDNTALAALQSIVAIANKAKIPVYSDPDSVEMGALAALGPDQYQIGIQTGKIIARALKGEELESIPVELPNKTDLYINEKAAAIIGIIIPNDIKSQATKIIK